MYQGTLGDRFGRRAGVLFFSISLTISLVVSQFFMITTLEIDVEVKYTIYCVSQFLIGMLVNGLYGTAYVLLMEFTTEKHKTIFTNINSYFYIFGELLVLVVYYIFKSWHVLNWFLALNSFLLLVLIYFLLPESPAWLISCERFDEANQIFKKMAKINGKKSYKSPVFLSEENADTKTFFGDDEHSRRSVQSKSFKCIDYDLFMLKEIFVPQKTFIKTCLLIYVWAAIMLIYYGISLGVTSVDLVNPYVMFFFSAIVEIIGYTFCLFNNKFGLKYTLSSFFLIAAVMLAFLAFLTQLWSNSLLDDDFFSPKAIAMMCFALVGKCVISGELLFFV